MSAVKLGIRGGGKVNLIRFYLDWYKDKSSIGIRKREEASGKCLAINSEQSITFHSSDLIWNSDFALQCAFIMVRYKMSVEVQIMETGRLLSGCWGALSFLGFAVLRGEMDIQQAMPN